MSKLSLKQSNAILDASISRGESRVYNQHIYNKQRTKIIRDNRQVVLDYIFGLNDVNEETQCIQDLNSLKKEYDDKLVPVTDNGLYIYTEKEIKKYGRPVGEFKVN
jgi:hypothetical protein